MIGRLFRALVRSALALVAAAVAVRTVWTAGRPGAPSSSRPRSASWPDVVRPWAFTAAVLGVIAGIGGFFVLVSGIVPIKASSGHWAITEAFLQFAKRRSIATHTLTIDVPSLDQSRLVMMGAGQYDFGCRPCHGSPALPQPAIAARMLPRPPDLRQSVATYDAAALFYIVKHGIKLTGMPAWPASNRDDEVWAMVAFLRRLPQLDPHEYRELAGTVRPEASPVPLDDLVVSETPPDAVLESCRRCHGIDGMGRGGAFPRLAGQRPAYLMASLEAYKRGQRHSGIMGPVAAPLDSQAMQQIAQYYGSRTARPAAAPAPPASEIERGQAIATRGLPDRLVPACVECHGPGARRRNPHYPVLAGQYADYLVQQLSLFKAGHRGGTPYQHIMQRVARQLSEDQIRAVAAYYGSLRAQPE